MTWLPVTSAGGPGDRDRVLALAPAVRDAFSALYDKLWETSDPDILELCRLRIAQLLRCGAELARREVRAHVPEPKIDALTRYPTSPLFTERERACLAYAERVCADPTGITDDEVAAVKAHLGESEFVALTTALTVIEGWQRTLLVLGIESLP